MESDAALRETSGQERLGTALSAIARTVAESLDLKTVFSRVGMGPSNCEIATQIPIAVAAKRIASPAPRAWRIRPPPKRIARVATSQSVKPIQT